ncbi:hypothetical protein [Chryseobacterium sp. StRB126]|nr:hypothetical protein [Chryseobacterium sp. StRB126]
MYKYYHQWSGKLFTRPDEAALLKKYHKKQPFDGLLNMVNSRCEN